MRRILQSLLFATVTLTAAEAWAWPTTPISGVNYAESEVQGYAWKDQGSGAWTKWNSVAYRDSNVGDLKIARRSATSASPSWSAWSLETIDNSANDVGRGASIAIDADGVEYVSYVDSTGERLKVARRVGGGAGNCFAGSNWDCDTLVFGGVTDQTAIGLTFDAATLQHTVHVIFVKEDAGVHDLWYARKIGTGSWTTAWIRETNNVWLAPDALAFTSGNLPRVAYGESLEGIRLSVFVGPAQGNWTTSTIDANGTGPASLAIRSFVQNIAYRSATGDLRFAERNIFTNSFVLSTVTNTGHDISLALDDDLDPHISFGTAGAAKRAVRKSGTWTIDTADASAAGYGTSIKIDTQPAIDRALVVHDDGFGHIKVSAE
ncbi:hypothetical protein SAMN02745121_07368 [Nannocystis exedens]|uniref:Uncharacterized protein n=1 Tax=Nannocystis exedens TaxID=54 RepID=A0A1I2GL25_9BACT|nr:hypothetical protein [Nannocystis exedens]PCC73619.1 hypothetical protein NAEX_06707 [Nannocystis exedens]SFF17948.1 hypothetical protein SAMN02745121_07368 [Nannocystis exedens]